MSTVDLSVIVNAASQKISSSYDLEAEFVDSVKKALESVLKKYYIYDTPQQVSVSADVPAKKSTAEKADKAPRKKSAYNAYVKAHMGDYKDVPHQERMGKIATAWKLVDEAGRKKYQDMADVENATLTSSPTATATTTA